MEVKSDIPVMKFCEWCYATLKEDGACPTQDCIHDELMELNNDDESNQNR